MTINELKEFRVLSDLVSFRRRVVSCYELGFITVEQVVSELKISRTELRRLCRFYYLQRIGLPKEPIVGRSMAKSKHTLKLEQRISELEKLLSESVLAVEAKDMMLSKAEKRYGLAAGTIKKKRGSKSSKPSASVTP